MRCAWCRAPLVDADGEPRWDLFGAALEFVCYGRCQPRPPSTHQHQPPLAPVRSSWLLAVAGGLRG